MSRTGSRGTGASVLPAIVSHGIGTTGLAASITLRVPPEMMDTLRQMSTDIGQPLDEVFNRAIGFYREAVRAAGEGLHVGYAASPDALEVEFTGLIGPGVG